MSRCNKNLISVILEVEEPIEYGVHAYPICAPDVDRDYYNETGVIAGWGVTRDPGGGDYHILYK